MKRRLILFALLAIAGTVLGCPQRRGFRAPSEGMEDEQEQLSAWEAVADRALRLSWELSPSRATALGVQGFDEQLPRYGGRDLKRTVDRLTQALQQLFSIEPAQLSFLDQVDRQLLIAELRLLLLELAQEGRPLNNPLQPVEETIDGVVALYLQDGRPLDDRLAAVAERLLRLPELLTAVGENLTTPAGATCRAALRRAAVLGAFADGELRELGGRAQADVRERLYLGIDETLRAIGAFSAELTPRCDEGPELIPIGAEAYAERLRLAHGVALSADGVAATAEEWLRRTGDALTRLEPSPPAPPQAGLDQREMREQLSLQVDSLRALTAERGLATLPPTVSRPRIMEAPALLARSAALYTLYPAPAFGAGSAVLLTPIAQGDARPAVQVAPQRELVGSAGLVRLAAETYPGLQLLHMAARRQPSTVRRTARAPIMIEGWGLYAAELALEHGLVTVDSEAKRTLLEETRAAAARALVDARLHTGALSYGEARAFLDENLALPGVPREARPAVLERELALILQDPTHAAAPLLGKLALGALRARAEAKKGAAFDLARFHDAVLAQGAIPPAYIASLLFRDPLPPLDVAVEPAPLEADIESALPRLED